MYFENCELPAGSRFWIHKYSPETQFLDCWSMWMYGSVYNVGVLLVSKPLIIKYNFCSALVRDILILIGSLCFVEGLGRLLHVRLKLRVFQSLWMI